MSSDRLKRHLIERLRRVPQNLSTRSCCSKLAIAIWKTQKQSDRPSDSGSKLVFKAGISVPKIFKVPRKTSPNLVKANRFSLNHWNGGLRTAHVDSEPLAAMVGSEAIVV